MNDKSFGVILPKGISVGDEIFNNYGAKRSEGIGRYYVDVVSEDDPFCSATEMLMAYGFCEEDNPQVEW